MVVERAGILGRTFDLNNTVLFNMAADLAVFSAFSMLDTKTLSLLILAAETSPLLVLIAEISTLPTLAVLEMRNRYSKAAITNQLYRVLAANGSLLVKYFQC